MKVYVVFREGVYRHECGGVFSSLEAANKAAEVLITNEDDDYHNYTVLAFELDEFTSFNTIRGFAINEPRCLISWKRRQGQVISAVCEGL